MPKTDVFKFKKTRKQITNTYTDTDQGAEITLTLLELDLPTLAYASKRGEEYAEDYCADGKYFAFSSGEIVPLTPDICASIAWLEIMQVVETEEDRYTFPDWVQILKELPEIWFLVNNDVRELIPEVIVKNH